jgi:2-polyprenyl-6-hydroxyphenyl methylase/3-demethylubiquinone-9 3-methyltransferase
MAATAPRPVNNAIYDALAERWYTAQDDPVALLRAESRLRNPWIERQLKARVGEGAAVLDVGCGGGFSTNALAQAGYRVQGLDASAESLQVAKRHDVTGTAAYVLGDAELLPFPDRSFDAVCALDLLEHVERPASVVREAARVLRPGGLFFFHTFNRNPLAWLIVIKGVEWFVRNTPPDMHVLHLFLKPEELAAMCGTAGLQICELHGTRPRLTRSFFRMLLTRSVPDDFEFRFCRSTRLGYTGLAIRRSIHR